MSYKDDFMGNYPPGAANNPLAPWNEKDPPEKLFGITVSCSLSKDIEVTSDNYDETGFNGAGSLNEPWAEYTDNEYTVEQIIDFAKQCAELMLTKQDYSIKSKRGLRIMLDSCKGWTVDEENAEQV